MPAGPDFHFSSDNTAGICPEAWATLAEANRGRLPSYGGDDWTLRATALIRQVLEKPDAEVFFVFNGTAANALALAAYCQSYDSVICHDYAHIETDECGAPEFFTHGAKIRIVVGPDGKLPLQATERVIRERSDVHYPKSRVLSLTQSTEWGTVYTPADVRELSTLAHRHGLAVHMDGSRFANAVASLGVSPADLTWRAGVDVLCFGGTKNGMNTAEAVVFFNPEHARDFIFRRKQAGQLASKMRFLSSQWVGMLEDGAWLRHASHANAMTQKLCAGLRTVPGFQLLTEPQANAVFVDIPPAIATALRDRGWRFITFIGENGCRLMCSWDTHAEDLENFLSDVKAVTSGKL
jgi:threonine aldolase